MAVTQASDVTRGRGASTDLRQCLQYGGFVALEILQLLLIDDALVANH